jgi:hypothetical protein
MSRLWLCKLLGLAPPGAESIGVWGNRNRYVAMPVGGAQTSHQPIRFRVIGRGQSPGALVT